MNCLKCTSGRCSECEHSKPFREESLKVYKTSESSKIHSIAADVEVSYHSRLTRLEELMMFARRRGIDSNKEDDKRFVNKAFSENLIPINKEQIVYSASDCGDDSGCGDPCTNEDPTGCTNGQQECINNECTNNSTGGCTNESGEGYSCHDNDCSNLKDCSDSGECHDNSCSNKGWGTPSTCTDTNDCSDSYECSNTAQWCTDSDNCTDTACSNTASKIGLTGGGCVDNNNCVDQEACLNNDKFNDCVDNDGCSDKHCDNRNDFGEKCIDNDACRDDKCCNRNCSDLSADGASVACGDDLCSTGRVCIDTWCTDDSGSCGDIGCINAGKPGGTGDNGCVDN